MPNNQPAGPGRPFSDPRIAEYERQLLGAYIEGAPIGAGITENVFLSGAHRVVFPMIRELKTKGLDLDIAILVSELDKRGLLDTAGGPAHIASLTDGTSTVNAEFYESEVLTASRGRSIWKATALAKEALEKGEAPDAVSVNLTAALETVTGSGATGGADSGILFRDLLEKEFPPDNWIIEGLRACV